MLQQLAKYRFAILIHGIIFGLILLLSVDIATSPLRIEALNLIKISHFSYHLLILPLLLVYWPIHKLKQRGEKTKNIYLIALLLSIAAGVASATYTHTISNPGGFLFQIRGGESIDEQGNPSTSFYINLSTSVDGYDYDTGWPMYFAECFLHALYYMFYSLMYLQFYALSRKRKLRYQLKQQQLDILGHQLNPHFLFNSLNSIRGMLFEDSNEAKVLLHEFRNLFKSHFANKEHKIALKNEVELCQRYLKLEHVRFEERLKVNWLVDSHLGNTLVPSMSLFTLIENAIKHGIGQLISGGKIKVQITTHQKELILRVTNPTPESSKADGTKTGLANLDTRLRLLYNSDYQLQTKRKYSQYEVTLIVPLQEQANA